MIWESQPALDLTLRGTGSPLVVQHSLAVLWGRSGHCRASKWRVTVKNPPLLLFEAQTPPSIV